MDLPLNSDVTKIPRKELLSLTPGKRAKLRVRRVEVVAGIVHRPSQHGILKAHNVR